MNQEKRGLIVFNNANTKDILSTKTLSGVNNPTSSLEDKMKSIGDRTPISYLEAAVAYHRLQDVEDIILTSEIDNPNNPNYQYLSDIEWNMVEKEPEIWEPHFSYNDKDEPVIVFYAVSLLGFEQINAYTYTFSKNDYSLKVSVRTIAAGRRVVIF